MTRLNDKHHLAPSSHRCDICLGNFHVRWARIPAYWTLHDPALNGCERLCHICESCQGTDGGIMTTTCINGTLVYRLGSQSLRPGQLVIVLGEHTVQ